MYNKTNKVVDNKIPIPKTKEEKLIFDLRSTTLPEKIIKQNTNFLSKNRSGPFL